MLKESSQVVRHYWLMGKLFDVKRVIIWSLTLMILSGILKNVNVFFEGMFYGVAGVAMGETLYAFVCACIKEHLENTCIQLGNFEKIKDFSSDEMFEVLRVDAKVHSEVVATYKNEMDKEIEKFRYSNLRNAHFAVWFSKNMDRVSGFCESSDFKDEVLVERFKVEQAGYFDEIAELFSDHELLVKMVRTGQDIVNNKLETTRAFITE